MTKSKSKASFDLPIFAKSAQILILVAIGSYLSSSIHFPDFYEHLTIGNWILANGSLPDRYLWTLVGSNLEWANPHWLFEVIVSFLDTQFGIKGLILGKLFFCILVPFSFSILFSTLAKDAFVGTIVAILISCGILFHTPFLPSLTAWSLMAFMLHQAVKFRDSEKVFSKELVIIFLLSLLYVNIHGSFLFCILTVLFFVRLSKAKYIAFGLVCIVAAISNPYFGQQILTSIQTTWNHFYLDVVLQREPASIYNFTVAFLVLLWLVFALFWHYVPKAISITAVIFAGFVTLLGLGSSFALPYSLFLLGIILSIVWSKGGYENKKNLGEAIFRLRNMLAKITASGMLWFLSCICIVNIVNQYRRPESNTLLPVKEVDFMIDRGLREPLFHEGFIGGYLVYRFSDEKGVPKNKIMHSDYSLQLYPRAAIADYSLKTLGEDWSEGFSAFAPSTVLCRASSPLFQFLSENPDWRLIITGVKEDSRELNNNPFLWAVFERNQAD